MKNKGKSKRGISLIVLVITIIVMIILAGAIILSLNSSGIIGRANEARNKSDMTNKKEAVGMFAAEYEMKAGTGEIDRNVVKVNDYVKQRLEEEGMETSDVYVTEQGEILIGSGAKATEAGVEIGATVEGYIVTEKTYTTIGKEVEGKNTFNGANIDYAATPAKIKNKTDFTWKYIGNDKNGNMLITPDLADITTWPTMTLKAQGGYLYGPDELNKVCKELYSTNKGTARCMNIDDVNMILGYTGTKGAYYDKSAIYIETEEPKTIKKLAEKEGVDRLVHEKTPNGVNTWEELGSYKSTYYRITNSSGDIKNTDNKSLIYLGSSRYWLASSCTYVYFSESCVRFLVRGIYGSSVDAYALFDAAGNTASYANALRPVVLLTSDIEISYDAETNTCTIK